MDSNLKINNICLYCHGAVELRHEGVFAKFKRDHGPFDIYTCSVCGSCQTYPMPSAESLTALYGSYQNGLPELHRAIMADDPQGALYGLCVDRIGYWAGYSPMDEFSWADIGAGGGEFSVLMQKKYPRSHGVAVDLHARPKLLDACPQVEWRQLDINDSGFTRTLSEFDVVTSIAVWEHVLSPSDFAANLLKIIRPRGLLYLMCPNNGSLASRLLGKRWPYFNPGEHLSIPTTLGAVQCLQREWQVLGRSSSTVAINSYPLLLPYSLRYVMRRLGLHFFGKLLPSGWGFPLPSGALEAVVSARID